MLKLLLKGLPMNVLKTFRAILRIFAVVGLIWVIGSHCALAKNPENKGKSDKGDKSEKIKEPKEPLEERVLGSLRDNLNVSDAEWQALEPYLARVAELTRELHDLEDGGKAFDL